MADARKCRFHPEKNATVTCFKYNFHYCGECLDSCEACSDPNLYCKHRTSCVVWELCRKKVKRSGSEPDRGPVGRCDEEQDLE